MSETTEAPGTEPVAPATPPPQSTPAPDTGTTDAPEQAEEEGERQSKRDRRFAELSARLTASQRERDALRAEAEFYRRQTANVAPEDETPEQRYQRDRAAMRTEVEAQIRAETFHQQGATQFGDWKQRCDDLVAMGADAGFAQLLVEMPAGEGVRVAAALAADPDTVERIAQMRTERARAVALGKYAATIEDAPAASATMRVNGATAAPTPVTRAPAPVRPVTGRAAPQFNEYAATPQQLVDFYMRQAIERRKG